MKLKIEDLDLEAGEVPVADFMLSEEDRRKRIFDSAVKAIHAGYDRCGKAPEDNSAWIVMVIDGDTETHYVNPVMSVAICESRAKAIAKVREIVTDNIEDGALLDSRHEYADRIEYRLDRPELIISAMAVR